MSNVDRVRSRMKELGISAALITDITNVRWITEGFTGSYGMVIVTSDSQVFISSSIYELQSQQQIKGFEFDIFGTPRSANDVLRGQFESKGITSIAFEPSSTFSQVEAWKKDFPAIQWSPASDLLSPLRMIKTASEIELIKAACKLNDECFAHVLGMAKEGVTEYELGLEIEFFFRRQNAEVGFSPIVVSGANSAKPHGRPSAKKLEHGDFVTFDLGCTLDSYNSDMTRTVVVGEASPRHARIYELVLAAEVAGIEALTPGANGKDSDRIAREILDQDDLSQYFGHSLGHGLGRAVHDFGRLSVTADQPIEVGQVWTVEPGVYIDGFGGVRIEDDVVVTTSGPEVISHSPKHLICI